MATMFPIGGTIKEGYASGKVIMPTNDDIIKGHGPGPITLGMPKDKEKWKWVYNLFGGLDNYLGWIKPFNARSAANAQPAPPAPPAPTPNGFSRKDYRDADTFDSEFAYASIKRDARERGFNVIEMPDMRMKSEFGSIGYEKGNDIYVAMSKANTKEGVEVIAHEFMAKDLQKRTGRYDHNYFHPVIEWLQNSAAMTYITGRNKPDTMDGYVQTAMEACAA